MLSRHVHTRYAIELPSGGTDRVTNDQAVRYGIARTAAVVTCAAIVMVGVLSLFATAASLDLKQRASGSASPCCSTRPWCAECCCRRR